METNLLTSGQTHTHLKVASSYNRNLSKKLYFEPLRVLT